MKSRIRRPRREFGRRASTAVTQVLKDDACLIAIVRSDSRQALRVASGIVRSYRLERCSLGALIGAQYPHPGLLPTDHELRALAQAHIGADGWASVLLDVRCRSQAGNVGG